MMTARKIDPEDYLHLTLAEARERYGVATPAEEAARRLEMARDEAREYTRDRLRLIGCPEEHVRAVFRGVDEHGVELYRTDAEGWLRGALGAGKRLLVLCGRLGTGKTLAVVRWLADQEGADMAHRFLMASELGQLNPGWSKDAPKLVALARVGTLVVDEVGDKGEDDTRRQRLEDLVHKRFEEGKTTILLANLLPQRKRAGDRPGFKDIYAPRIISRVLHSGGIHPCRQVVRRGEQRRLGL